MGPGPALPASARSCCCRPSSAGPGAGGLGAGPWAPLAMGMPRVAKAVTVVPCVSAASGPRSDAGAAAAPCCGQACSRTPRRSLVQSTWSGRCGRRQLLCGSVTGHREDMGLDGIRRRVEPCVETCHVPHAAGPQGPCTGHGPMALASGLRPKYLEHPASWAPCAAFCAWPEHVHSQGHQTP